MSRRRCGLHRLLLAGCVLLLSAVARAAPAGEVPAWPTEREQRLKDLDAQLLDVQRQRFAAVFGTDKDAVKRWDKQFAELQNERRQLLRATGRLPY